LVEASRWRGEGGKRKGGREGSLTPKQNTVLMRAAFSVKHYLLAGIDAKTVEADYRIRGNNDLYVRLFFHRMRGVGAQQLHDQQSPTTAAWCPVSSEQGDFLCANSPEWTFIAAIGAD
jgi:hypothetical protein